MKTSTKVTLGITAFIIVFAAFTLPTYADCIKGRFVARLFGVSSAQAAILPCIPSGGQPMNPDPDTEPGEQPPTTWALTSHWGNTSEKNDYFSYTKGISNQLWKQQWDFDGDGYFEWGQFASGSFDNWDMYVLTENIFSVPGTYTSTFKSIDTDGNESADTTTTRIYNVCPPGSGPSCTNTVWDGFKWLPDYANTLWYTIDIGSYPQGSPIPVSQAVAAIESALARWSAASGGVNFTPNPLLTIDGVPGRCNFCGGRAPFHTDLNSTIYWPYTPDEFADGNRIGIGNGYRTFPQVINSVTGDIMGVTTCTYNATRQEFTDAPQYNPNFPTNPYLPITSCDTVLSGADVWSVAESVPAGKWDLESYMMRALGNWLGLEELTTVQSQDLIMHVGTGQEEVERTLGAGDLLGIQALYGP